MSNKIVEPDPPGRNVSPRRPMSKTVRRILIFLLCLFALNTVYWPLMAGLPTVMVLATASRVEVFQLRSRFDVARTERERFDRTMPRIENSYVTGQGKAQGWWFARCLSAAVLQPGTPIAALTLGTSACVMQSAICFRAWSGRECVDVVLCFRCGQMALIYHDAQGRVSDSRVHSIVGLPVAPLKLLSHEALPNDQRFKF